MKEATITNGQFSWILEVDGEKFKFSGAGFAEYLRDHYRELGYKVIINDGGVL